jgi:hypothetical protein
VAQYLAAAGFTGSPQLAATPAQASVALTLSYHLTFDQFIGISSVTLHAGSSSANDGQGAGTKPEYRGTAPYRASGAVAGASEAPFAHRMGGARPSCLWWGPRADGWSLDTARWPTPSLRGLQLTSILAPQIFLKSTPDAPVVTGT